MILIVAYMLKKKQPPEISQEPENVDAPDEIKEETAQKFKISLAELRDIRDKYKLKY